MIARVLVFGVFFGVFAIGCKLLSIGYTILDDFAAQNFDIVDEAYGFFAVFFVSGFFFFWGFILVLPSGTYLLFHLLNLLRKTIIKAVEDVGGAGQSQEPPTETRAHDTPKGTSVPSLKWKGK